MKKPRMGRPPAPASELRKHRLTVGVTSEERREIHSRARAEGITPSDWLRDALLRALRRSKR